MCCEKKIREKHKMVQHYSFWNFDCSKAVAVTSAGKTSHLTAPMEPRPTGSTKHVDTPNTEEEQRKLDEDLENALVMTYGKRPDKICS